MRRRLVSGLFSGLCVLWAASVGACPRMDMAATASYDIGVGALLDGVEIEVVAGGAFHSAQCGPPLTQVDITHAYNAEPADVRLNLSGVEGHRLSVEVTGTCDTMLLVNASNGHFFYDDDDAGDLQPLITFTRPRSGPYAIWVGTYEPEPCEAVLRVRAFPLS